MKIYIVNFIVNICAMLLFSSWFSGTALDSCFVNLRLEILFQKKIAVNLSRPESSNFFMYIISRPIINYFMF